MTSLSTLWITLDDSVQQWLLQHPGTMVLPRTYVNMIEATTGKTLAIDDHGEHWLTPGDMQFLMTAVSASEPLRSSGPRASQPSLDPHDNALDQ